VFLTIFIPLAVVGGLGWLAFTWRRDVVDLEMESETAYQRLHQQTETDGLGALNKEDFIELYKRANRVRRPKYIVLFLALSLVSMAPTLMLGSFIQNVLDFGPLISQFIIFFLVILGWVGSVALTLRFYHVRRPGTVQAEYEKTHS
jgi:hypothetical protein